MNGNTNSIVIPTDVSTAGVDYRVVDLTGVIKIVRQHDFQRTLMELSGRVRLAITGCDLKVQLTYRFATRMNPRW